MSKHRGNPEDDKIFYLILPKWNEILDKDRETDEYRNPNNYSDGSLLTKALNDACAEYGWTEEDFTDYQKTLRR